MLAPSIVCHMEAGSSPASTPARPRMKENSPTCASPTADAIATRSGLMAATSAAVAMSALPAMIAAARPSISGRRASTVGRSISMPSEMKNSPASTSRTDRTSA